MLANITNHEKKITINAGELLFIILFLPKILINYDLTGKRIYVKEFIKSVVCNIFIIVLDLNYIHTYTEREKEDVNVHITFLS